jgi:hypothetical protein
MQSGSGARSRLTSVVAAGALAAAALSTVAAVPANAAVMVSGSVVDANGNYVEGSVRAVDGSGLTVAVDSFTNGAFDLPLNDGAYKLEFSGFDFTGEWYRDKADQATADVVTVAGVAQTLPAWTVARLPHVTGVVQDTLGKPVDGAFVEAFDASTGDEVDDFRTDADGGFRITTTSAAVKLRFSGYANGEQLATEYYNDKATLPTAEPVVPTAAGASVGVVTLAPGGSITGRITSDAGVPLHRARACAGGRCDWTDASGIYLIEGVDTGDQVVSFSDPIGEYVSEYYNNVPITNFAGATRVPVGVGQAVGGIDAALAPVTTAPPNGVDLSGTVRDELGTIGVGYLVEVYDTPADPDARKVVATTYSNRAGQYVLTELDRIGGETEFKVEVSDGDESSGPREEGDFLRRPTWSGNKLDYQTAAVVTAAPRTLDFTLPVAGGVSGSVTSDGGGLPESGFVSFRNSDLQDAGSTATETDGTYDDRTLWAGDYTVRFGGTNHVPEWWKNALPEDATTITVKPGQMTTGISASLSKEITAVERPEVTGNAWVGKTVGMDAGRWNTQAFSRISYEWLVGTTVVATTPTLKVTKSLLGKKLTGRVTNDAGFAQGQAITKTTPKVGYKPKVKAKVTGRAAAITLKVKPLKAKKVKATITVFEIVGVKKNGDDKRKKLGKGKITKGTGVVRFKKSLGKGKHKLVFSVKGKGKVGSGDIQKKVKLKR